MSCVCIVQLLSWHCHWKWSGPLSATWRVGVVAVALLLLLGPSNHSVAESRVAARNYNNTRPSLSTPVLQYCGLPEVLEAGAEGRTPPGHRLLKVFAVTRHGSRFVMHHTRFGPLLQPRLSCQFTAEQLSASIIRPLLGRFVQDVARGMRRHSYASPAAAAAAWTYPPAPGAPLCGHAHLTPLGSEQLLLVGARLQAAYTGQLNLTSVRVHSTDTRRTYQSAVALLYGLLGFDGSTAAAAASVTIDKVEAHNENFCDDSVIAAAANAAPGSAAAYEPVANVSCSCASVKRLKRQARAELKEQLEPSDAAHARFVAAAVRVFRGGRAKAKPEYPWKRAHDYLMQSQCRLRHGSSGPLPCYRGRCFTPRDVEDLWAHLTSYFGAMSRHETFARKSRIEMQPLLWEVLQLANEASRPLTNGGREAGGGSSSSSGRQRHDLYVYSGHDVTITSLALALGIPFDRWPAYASTLVLELYERLAGGSRFVRVLYAGRDVTERARFFRPPSRDLCPWEAFEEYAGKDNLRELGYDSWSAACA